MQPLQGLTVVTHEHAIAAPFATRQLADLGARVIKVERPGGGDFARRAEMVQQRPLAAERGIKTRPAQSRGTAKIIDRGRLITLRPERMHRPLQRCIAVERPWSCH